MKSGSFWSKKNIYNVFFQQGTCSTRSCKGIVRGRWPDPWKSKTSTHFSAATMRTSALTSIVPLGFTFWFPSKKVLQKSMNRKTHNHNFPLLGVDKWYSKRKFFMQDKLHRYHTHGSCTTPVQEWTLLTRTVSDGVVPFPSFSQTLERYPLLLALRLRLIATQQGHGVRRVAGTEAKDLVQSPLQEKMASEIHRLGWRWVKEPSNHGIIQIIHYLGCWPSAQKWRITNPPASGGGPSYRSSLHYNFFGCDEGETFVS